MSVDILQERIRKLKNPTMVCISPSALEIPMQIKDQVKQEYGETLKAAAEAYKLFSFGILDCLKDIVPAVSVVSGSFTALGADGVAAVCEASGLLCSFGYDAVRSRPDSGYACCILLRYNSGWRSGIHPLRMRWRADERLSRKRFRKTVYQLLQSGKKRVYHCKKLQ